jgi:uncharacterized protein (TIGR00369 family)
MSPANRVNRIISKMNLLPDIVRQRVISMTMGKIVPYVGTSLIRIEEMTADRVVATIPNKRRVQNHIKNVHAAAMALLAETASGFVVVMNLPDDKLPLIKSLHVDYKKRTKGDMRVVATLTEEQKQKLASEPKGDVSVEVHVTDGSGGEPIRCEMIWAWVPNKKKK